MFYQLNYRRLSPKPYRLASGLWRDADDPRLAALMGSLIKKRRKRMRKKKHRKLLKRTRVQRRNKK